MKTKQAFVGLLLSLIMFISAFTTVFLSASAAECTHSWSVVEVNVDAHVSACSLCGASKSEAHTWNTAEKSCEYVDDHYHQQFCTGCKQIRIIPHGTKGSTTMGGWEAGLFNWYYWCRGCDDNASNKDIAAQYHATSASSCSSHEYKVLSYDGEGHILECRKCGTTKEKAVHNWSSMDSNGLATCTAGCKAYIEGSAAPEVSPDYPIEYYFSQRGPYTVSAQEFSDFTDPEGQFNHIKIWYPTDMTTTNNQWPTIVFCNGSGSGYGPDKDGKTLTDQTGYTALFEHFASWGFILVANNRPGCASSNATDTTLNYLLNRNTISGDLFYNKVDMDKIGIAGHSQGGTAVLQNLSGSTVTSNVNYTYECTQYYKAAWSASPQAYDNILKWTYTPENITCPTIMVCADNDWASSNDILTTNSGKMSGIPVVTAVRKNADHGAMVSIGKGYMIAWFRYALLGDCYAAQAFVGNAELINNTTWQNQSSQELGQITYHSYTNYESDSNATCNNVGTKTADCDFATFHGTEYTCNQSHTVSGDTYGNHQWSAATCTSPKACSVCTITEGEALGHSYASVVIAPTCTTQGYTTHTCSRCSDSYKDNYTDAAGHSYNDGVVTTDPTCTEAGVKTFTCATCGDTYTEAVAALGHDEVSHEAKAPTCTEIGWDAYVTCSRCDYTTYVEKAALGHTLTQVEAKAPTCTEAGYKAYEFCTVCDYTTYEAVAATGHDYDAVVTAPTCTADGYTTYTCHCGDTYIADTVSKLGHTEVVDAVVAPTCTATGLTEGKHCSVCEEILVAQETVDALGHSYDDGVVTTDPTCIEAGVKTFTCETCGDTYTESVVALGHDEVPHEAKAPTCTAIGWDAYVTCSRCDYTTCVEKGALGHNYTSVVTAPTCTADGYTTYTCHCGDTYIADTVSKLGHTEVVDAVVAPTCTATGLTEGKHCSVCEEILVAQETVDALGHSYDDGVVTTDPTCIEAGVKTFTCETCGDTYTESVVAFGHDEVSHEAKAPTCTEIGWDAYVTCSRCSYTTYVEKAALGHTLTQVEAKDPTCTEAGYKAYEFCTVCDYTTYEAVAATGHDYDAVVTAPTCTADGYTTYTCHCGDTYIADTVSKLGHTEVVDAVVAPTCTATGLTEGKHCSVCEEVLVAQEVVDALGHDMIVDKAVAPTCTATGLTEGSHCSRCDHKVAQTVVDALGHDMVTDKAVAATCTATGLTEGKHCSRCDHKVAQTVVDALGHDMIVDKAVAPTCTATGLTEGSHCSRCDHKVAQTVVDALGHDMIVDKAVAPTCTATGLTEGSHCSRCDHKVAQTVVDALGHDMVTDKAVAPDCLNTGLTEGSHCSVCEEVLVAQEVVDALGHNTEGLVEHKDATCTEAGVVGGTYCSRCNDGKEDAGTTIEKLGHEYVDGVCIKCDEKDPDCPNSEKPEEPNENNQGTGINIFERILRAFREFISRLLEFFKKCSDSLLSFFAF